MKQITRLEEWMNGHFKTYPHLPNEIKHWFASNIWWLVAIIIALIGISALSALVQILSHFFYVGTYYFSTSYYDTTTFIVYSTIRAALALFFAIIQILIFVYALKPLKNKEKKGWVLLFIAFLVNALAKLVDSIMMFDAMMFVFEFALSCVWYIAVFYILFEIRTKFSHTFSTNNNSTRDSANSNNLDNSSNSNKN